MNHYLLPISFRVVAEAETDHVALGAEIKERAKAASLRSKAAKLKVKIHRLEVKVAKLRTKSKELEDKANAIDRIVNP